MAGLFGYGLWGHCAMWISSNAAGYPPLRMVIYHHVVLWRGFKLVPLRVESCYGGLNGFGRRCKCGRRIQNLHNLLTNHSNLVTLIRIIFRLYIVYKLKLVFKY